VSGVAAPGRKMKILKEKIHFQGSTIFKALGQRKINAINTSF
jgi:hypothetical protein